MRAIFPIACALALAPLLAVAQSKETKQTKLPLNPFATAKEGDWESLVMKLQPPNGTARVTGATAYRIQAVAQGKATVRIGARASAGVKPLSDADKTYTTAPTITLEEYMDLAQRRVVPAEVKIEQERKTVHGNEFVCTKVSYGAKVSVVEKGKPESVVYERTTIWISKEVRSWGLVGMLVELRAKGDDGEPDSTVEFEVAGYGQGEKTEWGKKLEEIDLPAAPKQEPPSPDKPVAGGKSGTGTKAPPKPAPDAGKSSGEGTRLSFNPAADAQAGDWEAMVMTIAEKKETTPEVRIRAGTVQRVTKVEGDRVEVASEAVLPSGVRKKINEFVLSRNGMPLLESGLGLGEDEPEGTYVAHSKVICEETSRKIGSREFACTKAAYSTRVENPKGEEAHSDCSMDYELWFSKDPRVSGLVFMSLNAVWARENGTVFHTRKMEVELAGFGREGTVDWGKKPEDIAVDPGANVPGADAGKDSVPGTKLPFDPGANAKVGDWEAFVLTNVESGEGARGRGRGVIVYRVAKVDEDRIEIAIEGVQPDGTRKKGGALPFPRKDATVESLLGIPMTTGRNDVVVTRSKVALEQTKRKIAGREFACTKAVLSWRLESVPGSQTNVGRVSDYEGVWFSKDVRGAGLVAVLSSDVTQRDGKPGVTSKQELELAGYGREGTVEWGKRPEDIELPK